MNAERPSMPNRQELLQIPHVTGDPIALECVGVEYCFGFNLKAHSVAAKTVFEIGRNDVDIPIVIEPESGHIYFLAPDRGLSFINSSFPQMLAVFEFVNAWDIPDDIPDSERARIFGHRMLEIDENLFSAPEACWSTMREEIGYGVI